MKQRIISMPALLCLTVVSAWADGYYVVGTMTDWKVNSQYKLSVNPGNTAEMMIPMYFQAGAEFKVVYSEDGENAKTWYPGDGNNYYVTNEGRYTVYFRSDYGGGSDWHYNCIYVASTPDAVTPTGTKNQWTFQMPAYDVEVNVEYETALTLSEEADNAATLKEWDGYEADVTLTRTLSDASWNTLAVPFNVSSATIALINASLAPNSMTIKKLASTSLQNGTLTLNFEDADEIEAGKPYLVKVPTTFAFAATPFAGIIMSNAEVPFTSDYVDFIPTLGKTLVTGPTGNESNTEAVLFFAAGNTLKNPTVVNDPGQESSYMKGFRAYFQLKGDAISSARSFSLNLGEDVTGISLTPSPSPNGEGSDYYTIDGRKLQGQPTNKGVYIVNGKKVIIK